jgi:hypothetical protein
MTVEEKAGMYAAKTEADFGFDMHPKTASFQGFIDGYSEAMRWRDPKEELPKDEQVLVKTDKDEILLVTYWVEKGDFVYWDTPVDNVIGWRPIE